MRYVTGLFALNIPCNLDTDGDWHLSGLNWERVRFKDSEGSRFGKFGLEFEKQIPEHTEKFAVANHIRALLDILEDGRYGEAQGMREDFINNENYTGLIFDKVYELKDLLTWKEIDDFMGREYDLDWLNYKRGKENGLEKKGIKR